MKRQNERTLWLQVPEGSQAIPASLLAIVCAAAIDALSGMTGLSSPMIPMIAGAATCIAYGFLRKSGWFWPLVLGLMLGLTVLFRDAVAGGFFGLYNSIGAVYTQNTGIVIPALKVAQGHSGLFPILLGMGFGAVCCGLSVLGGPVLGSILMAGYALAAGMLEHPGDPLPLLVACGLLMLPRRRKALIPAVLLCALVAVSLTPTVEQWTAGASAQLQREYHQHHYETDQTTLPEGSLSAPWTIGSDASALVVTMEKPEKLYLRGFTGAVLEDSQWSPLDNGTLAEEAELLYWLKLREFDLHAQFEAASSTVETEENTVTVQNLGACSAYRYIPFTLRADASLSPEAISPDGLDGHGARYDTFTTVYQGAEVLPEVLEALEKSSDYRRAESAYRTFVEKYYRNIPAEATELLQPYWEDLNAKSPAEAIDLVLERCLPEEPESSPRAVTVTVLTLRQLGIPARYAEGYIVPESAEATIQVNASCAACWAEVYQDGIGWIPMALTPGVSEDAADQTEDPPPEQPETPPEETQPQEQKDPTGGTRIRLAPILRGMLLVFLALILLLLLFIMLRRALILRRQHRRFAGSDAVPLIFTDAVLLLARMGVKRGNGSLYAMLGPIRERFGEGYADQFHSAADRNAAALFSSRRPSETDRDAMLKFRQATLELLTADAPWYKRLWMQYILCLY